MHKDFCDVDLKHFRYRLRIVPLGHRVDFFLTPILIFTLARLIHIPISSIEGLTSFCTITSIFSYLFSYDCHSEWGKIKKKNFSFTIIFSSHCYMYSLSLTEIALYGMNKYILFQRLRI